MIDRGFTVFDEPGLPKQRQEFFLFCHIQTVHGAQTWMPKLYLITQILIT
jgi:hypothetical protein